MVSIQDQVPRILELAVLQMRSSMVSIQDQVPRIQAPAVLRILSSIESRNDQVPRMLAAIVDQSSIAASLDSTPSAQVLSLVRAMYRYIRSAYMVFRVT